MKIRNCTILINENSIIELEEDDKSFSFGDNVIINAKDVNIQNKIDLIGSMLKDSKMEEE